MSHADPDILAASLEAVAERVGDPAALVYGRLFSRFPEMEALFVRDVTGAVRGEMLAMTFQCLMARHGGFEDNMVRAERMNHDGFGVPAEAFLSFFPILKETCQEVLGEGWTPEVEAAWRARLTEIAEALGS